MKLLSTNHLDFKISELCLGTAKLGTFINYKTSELILDCFYEAGGNFIDTANFYANWYGMGENLSEKTIAKWMNNRQNRNKIVLCVKICHPNADDNSVFRISPAKMIEETELALKALNIECIDILMLHKDDNVIAPDLVIETFEKLFESGKIKYYGVSNWSLYRLSQLQELAKKKNATNRFLTNQLQWSGLIPDQEFCKDQNIASFDDSYKHFHEQTGLIMMGYSPFASGYLNQIRSKNEVRDNYLAGMYNLKTNEHIIRNYLNRDYLFFIIDNLKKFRETKFVAVPVIGCSNESQLKEIIKMNKLTN